MKYSTEAVLKAAREGAERYEAEEIEVLKQLAATDCGSRDEEGNARVVEIIDGCLKKIPGIEIEHDYYEGFGTNIIARLRPAHPSGKILLNAHLDTVFLKGDTAKYPWHVEGDKAYGLGIVDCKGGVLVSIYAVRMMAEAGLLPDKEIVMVYNCDEEIGSECGKKSFDKVMDGAEAAFVFEPARLENGVLTSRKGSCSISVDITGKAAHSGVNYTDGRSAVVELAHKILAFYEHNDNERGIQFNMAALESPQKTNIVPDHAACKVSVRVANDEDIETVKKVVEEVQNDTYIEGTVSRVTLDEIGVPMARTEGNVALYQKVKAAGALLGEDLPEQATGGSGDAAYFSYAGIPTVDALGPYQYKIHSHDESMRLSSVKEKTELFGVVLGTYE